MTSFPLAGPTVPVQACSNPISILQSCDVAEELMVAAILVLLQPPPQQCGVHWIHWNSMPVENPMDACIFMIMCLSAMLPPSSPVPSLLPQCRLLETLRSNCPTKQQPSSARPRLLLYLVCFYGKSPCGCRLCRYGAASMPPLMHTALLHTSTGYASAGIMSFKEGDVLIITEQQDSGWWIADLNGASGVVPSTCARSRP